MALAPVQSNTGSAGGYDSTTLAYLSNVTAGNLLTCSGAVWNGSEVTSITITDTLGSTWTVILSTNVSGGAPHKTWIGYAIAPSSGANTVTIDPNGGGRYSSHGVAEWSGPHATPLDVDGGTSTGSSTSASDGITTTDPDALVIEVMSQGSGGNHSLTADTGGGWTMLTENENAGNAPYATQYQIFSGSAGAKTATITIGASVAWVAQTVSFKPAGAATGKGMLLIPGQLLTPFLVR